MTYHPPLDGYSCGACGATGVKLWREYQSFAPRLRCARCTASLQGLSDIELMDARGQWPGSSGQTSDQIGWFVPAVPHPDGDGYWGYMSIPKEAYRWWRDLATFTEEVTA